ncbi:MAG TPA: ATP-binding protein [Gammaproteobacteria bacterium]|nr:ATP-binding protein [Gammaproteobacteria bacterium]
MKSIQTRLNLGLGLYLVITFLVIGLAGSHGMRLLVEQWLITRLEHDAETLLISLRVDTQGQVALNPVFQDPIYHRPYSGHYYLVDGGEAQFRSRSLWDAEIEVPRLTPGQVETLRMTGPQQQLLLVRVAGYEKSGEIFSIAVAEDLSPLRDSVRRYQGFFLLFSALALISLLLLQRHMLRLGLRPLQDVGEQLRDLERGQRQALSEAVPEEIQPLVRQVNQLLRHLQQRVERSRNGLGNLAHALKTPLSVIRQLTERSSLDQYPELRQQIRDQVEALHRRVEAELRRARLAGGAYRGEAVELGEELPALVEVLRMAHRDRNLDIEADIGQQMRYFGDREDLLEVVGNLLDNACKWAAHRVSLHVHYGDGLEIRVEDDGPGRDAQEREQLLRRGVRIDEQGVPGHGLGLAIVQEIVDALGGELHLGRSEALGGFQVDVRLPLH